MDASDKFCTLSNGVKVEEGWSGNDTGNNWCNKCRCMNGNLACTRMACINSNPDKTFAKHPSPDKTPKPTSTPTAISTSQAKPDSKHENENQLITLLDYSDDPDNPTFIEFNGNNILISDDFGGIDRDYITFTVPENTKVKSIILNFFEGEDDIAFFAIEKNKKYTAKDDINKMVSYGHFGSGTEYNKIGKNILYYDKNIDQKTREKVELEPGEYTIRLQQGTSLNASYSFTVYLE